LKIAIPNQGKLRNDLLDIFNQNSKLKLNSFNERSLYTQNQNGDEVYFLRSNDLAKLVESNIVDVGITGSDYILECQSDVKKLLDLDFCKGTLTLLVPQLCVNSTFNNLNGKTIATQYPNASKQLLNELGLTNFEILPTSGATEIYPALGLADATIDVVSSGNTYKANGLVPLKELFYSSATVFCSHNFFHSHPEKVNELVEYLKLKVSTY